MPVTADERIDLPRGNRRRELVGGEIVEKQLDEILHGAECATVGIYLV